MATIKLSRAAAKQALSMLLVLAVIVPTLIPEAWEPDAPALISFSDVPEVTTDHRFHDEIAWLVDQKITTGYADGTFRPTNPVTRQAAAAFLYRLAGEPPVTGVAGFTDVATGHRFHDEIAWLVEQKITIGYADGTFRPTNPVTRGAAAAFLYRLAGEPPVTGVAGFTDVATGHRFHDEIAWLVEQKITIGYADGTFRPTNPVTRQAMAAFIYRATDEGTGDLASLGRGNGRGDGRPSPAVDEQPADSDGANQTVGALSRTAIGSPEPAGNLSENAGVYTLKGAGADIWGTADSFEFAHQTLEGDGKVVVKVNSQTPTHEWAKAGLMIRSDLTPGSQHVSVFQTPQHGAVLQYRPRANANAVHVHGVPAGSPTWLELERKGSTFTARSSKDGLKWTLVGSVSVAMATVAFVGLAVTSHDDGTLSTAEVSDLQQVGPQDADTDAFSAEPPPADAAPSPSDDVGSPSLAASAALLSEDELAVQRDRATNGPFRAAGDFSANSPGHWNEMAATMRLNFSSARWDGPTVLNANGAFMNFHDLNSSGRSGQANDPPANVRNMAHDMMSAAYTAAITDNHEVAAAITKEIEYQATRPRLDYSNRTLWPLNYYNDLNPLFMHAVWVKDYVLAYDITKAMGHSSPTVERWFLDLAELNEQAIHFGLASGHRHFPNRKADSYSSRSGWVEAVLQDVRLANRTAISYPQGMRLFNNRRSQQAGLVGLVGVILDNTYYKDEFKRYVREWMMFGHRITDGHHGDINRGSDRYPQLGFAYALHGLESLVPAMDALARQGDTDLYEFSSSEGFTTGGGTNQFKTMEGVLDSYIKVVTLSYPAHYTGSGSPPSSSIAGDEFYRIRSRSSWTGAELVADAVLLLPANYYNRSDWRDAILRRGTPGSYTSNLQPVGQITGWRTDWRHRFLRSLDTDPYPTRG